MSRVCDIAGRFTVREARIDVAYRAVDKRGERSGLFLDTVDHHARPVAGYLAGYSAGGSVTTVMYQIHDAFVVTFLLYPVCKRR